MLSSFDANSRIKSSVVHLTGMNQVKTNKSLER